MSDDKKPDGFCAWHPEEGFMLATIAYDPTHAEGILCDQVEAAGIERPDEWILKPVYLSTEPPVSKKVFKLLEKIAIRLENIIDHNYDERAPETTEDLLKQLEAILGKR